MKIQIINLLHRVDRKERISKELKNYNIEFYRAIDGVISNIVLELKYFNFDIFRRWIDPLLERGQTLGEIGTAASHYMCWKIASELDEPMLILEDDSELIDNLDIELIENKLKNFDMIYLDYNEMVPEKVESIDDILVKPYYPYWTNAYVITPSFAKYLVNSNFKKNIFPVDEYFALLNNVDYDNYCLSKKEDIKNNFKYLKGKLYDKEIKIAAFKKHIFKQLSRDVAGSDIEVVTPINFHSFTVGTDVSKTEKLLKSAQKNNIQIINLGENVTWRGGNISEGTGGGQKINLLFNYLENKYINDEDIILFVDGYDVLINDSEKTIVERFLSFNADILFAAEKVCWPDRSLENKFNSHTPYKFLNSGCFIGYKWALRRFIESEINDSDDDQLFYQKKYLQGWDPYLLKVSLDKENYIFQCVNSSIENIKLLENGQLFNNETNTCPCILHGNGGPKDKEFFKELTNYILNEVDLNPLTSFISVTGQDILTGDIFSQEQCKKIISLAEENGNWNSLQYDKFPAQEIRVKTFSPELFKLIESHFTNVINSAIEKYWFPLQMYGIRDMFIIKYTPDTQSSLNCHHDASLVSGIIKLNDDYEGGDTFFHRQDFSNKDVPVGNIVLWPGQVTHGHEGRPVTSGTKYNLVIWTSRFPGDVNE